MNSSALRDAKQAILDRLRLEEEMAADGYEIEIRGNRGERICPFHSERTPSFKVDINTQTFKCFGCGKHGDVLDWIAYVMKKDPKGSDFYDVVAEGAARAGISIETLMNQRYVPERRPTPAPAPAAVPPKQHRVFATSAKLRAAVDYIAGRMQGSVVATFVYQDDTDEPVLVIFRIHIPQPDGGRKKSFLPATKHESGGWVLANTLEKNPLYNLLAIRSAPNVVLVEGETKVLHLKNLGISATTCAGGANAVKRTDWSLLAGKTVTLWRDKDDSGVTWQKSVIEELSLLRPRCKIKEVDVTSLNMLGQKDDVVDYLRSLKGLDGPDVVSRLHDEVLSRARSIGGISDLRQEFSEAIDGKRFWVPFCWPIISSALKPFRPGGTAILAGSPGSCKSFITLQNIAFWEKRGLNPIALMMEDGAVYHLNRAVAQIAGNKMLNDYEWIKANPEEANAVLERHEEEIAKIAHCLTAPKLGDKPDVPYVLSWIERACKAGHRMLIIDPITAMYRGRNIQEADFEFVMGSKALLHEYGASMFLTTHLRKAPGGKAGPITMDDLSGGQDYSKFTQVVLYLMAHEERAATVKNSLGVSTEMCNRTIQVMKTRDSWGQGKRFAFQWENVKLRELGEVVPE